MSSVPAAYRNLLRALSHTFRGDAPALAHSRAAARTAFREWRPEPAAADAAGNSSSTSVTLAGALAAAAEAATFLRENIAQAKLTPQGSYAMAITPPGGAAAGSPTGLPIQLRDAVDANAAASSGGGAATSGGCCGGGCR